MGRSCMEEKRSADRSDPTHCAKRENVLRGRQIGYDVEKVTPGRNRQDEQKQKRQETCLAVTFKRSVMSLKKKKRKYPERLFVFLGTSQ